MEPIYEFQAPQYFDFYSLSEKCEEIHEESSYFESINLRVTDESAFQLAHKRSSVLCIEQENRTSSVVKHVFSDAFETLMLQPTGMQLGEKDELTIKQEIPINEAYLYSIESLPKTPKRANPPVLVHSENKKTHAKEDSTYGGMPLTKSRNRVTITQPFSFEARNKEMLRKKQERLLKVQGEECQKFIPFHARPVPSFILSSNQNRLNIKSNMSRPTTPKFENKKNSKDTAVPGVFRARFPSVLYKEPFTPTKSKKSQSSVTKMSPNNDKVSKK